MRCFCNGEMKTTSSGFAKTWRKGQVPPSMNPYLTGTDFQQTNIQEKDKIGSFGWNMMKANADSLAGNGR